MKHARNLLLAVVALALAGCITGERKDGSFQRTLQVTGPVTLDITSNAGDINIHTGSANAVYVIAKIHARGDWSSMSAEEKLRRIQANFPIEQQGNTIRLEKIQDSKLARNVFIDYDLTVPAQTEVKAESGAGSQFISGIALSVDTRTGAGNITLQDVKGDAILQSGAGNIIVKSLSGSLTADSGAGSITLEGAPRSNWQVRVGAGSIHYTVPEDASFNLDAQTGFGNVSLKHGLRVDGTVASSHVQGKVGNGGPEVELNNGAGSIELR